MAQVDRAIVTRLPGRAGPPAGELGAGQQPSRSARPREALSIAPLVPLAQQEVGYHLFLLRRFAEATPFFEEALRLEPTMGAAPWMLAFIDLQRGEFASAVKRMMGMRALAGDQVSPIRLGQIGHMFGRLAKATKHGRCWTSFATAVRRSSFPGALSGWCSSVSATRSLPSTSSSVATTSETRFRLAQDLPDVRSAPRSPTVRPPPSADAIPRVSSSRPARAGLGSPEIRRRRIDRGSSPCPTRRRSRARTSPRESSQA